MAQMFNLIFKVHLISVQQHFFSSHCAWERIAKQFLPVLAHWIYEEVHPGLVVKYKGHTPSFCPGLCSSWWWFFFFLSLLWRSLFLFNMWHLILFYLFEVPFFPHFLSGKGTSLGSTDGDLFCQIFPWRKLSGHWQGWFVKNTKLY